MVGFGSVTKLHSGGVQVKVFRRSEQPQHLTNARTTALRDRFFFYEKNTGVAHFHVEAGPDGRFPVDQAAGLLAMHCMVRSQSPSDYIVMVQAEDDELEGLHEKTPQAVGGGKSSSQPGEADAPGRRSSRRGHEEPGQQGDRREFESLRADSEVPRLLAAGEIPGARPHGTRAGSFAAHGGSTAIASPGRDEGSAHLCAGADELSGATAHRTPGAHDQAAIDGIVQE